jgi:hypothetical protein
MSIPSMRRSGGVIRRAPHNAWGLSLWLGSKQDACAARAVRSDRDGAALAHPGAGALSAPLQSAA